MCLLIRSTAGVCSEVVTKMHYYKGMQFVPMKGMAAMYYETDADANVKRFMTVLEDVGEIERMDNPPMKRLFRPEMLEEVTAEEFERHWGEADSG